MMAWLVYVSWLYETHGFHIVPIFVDLVKCVLSRNVHFSHDSADETLHKQNEDSTYTLHCTLIPACNYHNKYMAYDDDIIQHTHTYIPSTLLHSQAPHNS